VTRVAAPRGRRRSTCALLLVACAAGILLAATACNRSSSGEKVLRIGALLPLTGPAARTGEEFQGAIQLAFERVGYKIGPYRVELRWIDSQSDPQKATTAYEEAVIRGRIDAGLLNWHSSVAVAVMEVTARHRVPHFFGLGATSIVNEKYQSDPARYGYWVAKGWPVPSKLTTGYVAALEDAVARGIWKPERKRAAIWGEDTDWGRSLGAALRDQLRAASWEVVSEDYFRITETDYYPLLRKLKDAGVALAAGTTTSASGGAALIKQAREIGLHSLIIANGLGWVGEWYSLTGPASDGVLDQIPGWTTPRAREFAAEFERRWKLKPSAAAAGLAYDYASFFIKVAERALESRGALDRRTLYETARDELLTGKLRYRDGLVMKEYRYSPESAPDPVVGVDAFMFPVLQYGSGQSRIIWPETWKDADLRAP
jgi:branched-chain amino acid transport system substrate-binding protein